MASLQDQALRRVDMYQYDPRKIEVEPGYNVRAFDAANDEDDAQLKESIRASGVRTPLTIRSKRDQVYVVAGHRRLAAVKELIAEGVEIKAVPCLPEAKGTTDEDRVLDLIRSNQGKPLTSMQRAEVIKRLLNFGWDEMEIATKIGCSRGHVNDMLTLASAERDVRQMVHDGEIAATTAIRAIRQEGDDAGAMLAEAVSVAKASGKKKVSATKALKAKAPAPVETAPIGVEVGRVILEPTGAYEALRREADGYIKMLTQIAEGHEPIAKAKAARALGWNVDEYAA